MEYTIDKETLLTRIGKEIARYASGAVSEDGVSLYDKYINTSRDKDTLLTYIESAITNLVRRMSDVAERYIGDTGLHTSRIVFNVPDFNMTESDGVSEAISNYITMSVTASWLLEKDSPKVESYATLANSAIENVVALLKTRRKPQRV